MSRRTKLALVSVLVVVGSATSSSNEKRGLVRLSP
jgi:hypothetical protein